MNLFADLIVAASLALAVVVLALVIRRHPHLVGDTVIAWWLAAVTALVLAAYTVLPIAVLALVAVQSHGF